VIGHVLVEWDRAEIRALRAACDHIGVLPAREDGGDQVRALVNKLTANHGRLDGPTLADAQTLLTDVHVAMDESPQRSEVFKGLLLVKDAVAYVTRARDALPNGSDLL